MFMWFFLLIIALSHCSAAVGQSFSMPKKKLQFVIDLNALAHNYYQKVSTQTSLLQDIKVGDKISLAYSYDDCPAYQSSFFIPLLALNANEFKVLSLNFLETT